ncbi:hypothetical protein BKA67DRAFT_663539 [Truncatella angustata]|uniref:Uncharacterized protein n=1 Tax=Truncatella angustata TaxID=152316 RepID=A0A9P8RPY1_9PEZI|nr:uncharacterized protein BKA67DRAFT_663539 [Truncatella angustata]KAH6647200.1 hypothetical protein BKA67DRAFT_663539 [Truncatella angustata]
MASQKEDQYGRLMHDEEHSENVDKELYPRFQWKISPVICLLISNTFLALVIVGLLARLSYQPTASTTSIPYTGVGPVQLLEDQLGVVSNVIQTYRFAEDNLDDLDFRKGDPYWRALFPKGEGQVYLEDEVIASYKLPPSMRNPAKGNLTAYLMAGYHSLHCIGSIRQSLGRFMAAHIIGEQYDITQHDWLHTVHCVADLRQVLLCNFDETLMPYQATIHPGYHQKKVCKNMRPIDEWLEYNYEGKFQGNV